MANIRINEIDLLRFIAAIIVLFFHYSFRGYAADNMSVMSYPMLATIAKYGYLGVELFFMISGFVILMSVANGSFRDFITSRIVRLYPAFWVCCTITFLTILLIGAPRYSASISQYLMNMTMLSGFIDIPPIDGVYWTLCVEIRFYILVAVLLLIGKINKAQIFIFFWLVASVILEIQPIETLCDLLITDYSAFFIAGSTYFLIWSKGLTLFRLVMIIISWMLAVYQSIYALSGFEKHYHAIMSPFSVAGIITTFFILMMLVALKYTGFIGRRRWLLIGAITYPLYLLHQNIGFMVFNLLYPTVNIHVVFWGTIIVVLFFAYAVHILVEKRLASSMKSTLNGLFR